MHYCAECVETVLHNVCATRGGGLVPRPVRPKRAYRDQPKLGLENQPASTTRKHSKWTREQMDQLSLELRDMPPSDR